MATVIETRPTGPDVTEAALYAGDRWQEVFARMRAETPISWCESEKFGPYWSVVTYKPIVHVEALPKIFSSSFEYGGVSLAFYADRLRPDERRSASFIAQDPPVHGPQRRVVAPAFGPAGVAEMKAEVAARTGALLDSLPVGETFDWVEKVSIELTTGMLAKLFDFPWEERSKLTHWSDVAGDVELIASDGGMARRKGPLNEMAAAFHALWEERKDRPGTDLVSRMIQSDSMSSMGHQEFIGTLALLIIGGNDTTRNTMSAYAYALTQYPGERAKLEADPSLAANAVQELIRWQTPLAHMRRTAQEDYELDGVTIRKGERVALWYISSNRDESVFDDPDRLWLDRPNARRHLSFGYGIHRCVGARVAEVQLVTLIEEMAKRRLRVVADGEPERVPACFVHGYKRMMARLEEY